MRGAGAGEAAVGGALGRGRPVSADPGQVMGMLAGHTVRNVPRPSSVGRGSVAGAPSQASCPCPPPPVPEEVHAGRLLLAVRLGDAGEHAVRAERAAQKPGGGRERGQLPAAPPALARGQPGRAAARHCCILCRGDGGCGVGGVGAGEGMGIAASTCRRLQHPPTQHPSIRPPIHPE